MTRRFLALSCTLVFGVQFVPAQAQETIHASTRLVQINVLAQDSKGQPVPDLTQQDFTLEVSGRRRPIQVFSIERNAMPGGGAPVSTELAFSNRAAAGDPNLVIILFDEYNTSPRDVAHARKQLLDTVSGLDANSRVAFYVLTHELKILFDFTTDRAALTAKLAAHSPAVGFTTEGDEIPSPGSTASPSLDAALGRAELTLAAARAAHRAEVTLDALNLISAHVAGVQGRKTLVWLTGGVPILVGHDPAFRDQGSKYERNLSIEVLRTSQALDRADIAVDVVDLRGLRPDDQSRIRSPRRPLPNGQPAFAIDANYESMATLAHETGGEVFRNTNDIGRAVKLAIRDSQVSYALGFYASREELDGSFRPLRLQVNRRGVHLRYRTGFLATPDPDPNERLKQPLAGLLGAPVSLSEIGLRIEIQHAPGGKYELTAHAGPSGLTLREVGGVWTGDFEWLAAAGRNGVYTASSQRLHIALKPDAYREVMAHGLTLTQSLALQAGDTEIGAAIRDVNTGTAGTLRLFHRSAAKRNPGEL